MGGAASTRRLPAATNAAGPSRESDRRACYVPPSGAEFIDLKNASPWYLNRKPRSPSSPPKTAGLKAAGGGRPSELAAPPSASKVAEVRYEEINGEQPETDGESDSSAMPDLTDGGVTASEAGSDVDEPWEGAPAQVRPSPSASQKPPAPPSVSAAALQCAECAGDGLPILDDDDSGAEDDKPPVGAPAAGEPPAPRHRPIAAEAPPRPHTAPKEQPPPSAPPSPPPEDRAAQFAESQRRLNVLLSDPEVFAEVLAELQRAPERLGGEVGEAERSLQVMLDDHETLNELLFLLAPPPISADACVENGWNVAAFERCSCTARCMARSARDAPAKLNAWAARLKAADAAAAAQARSRPALRPPRRRFASGRVCVEEYLL